MVRRKNQTTKEKDLRAEKRTNKLRPQINPMPHWWKGSDLITAPSLLRPPCRSCVDNLPVILHWEGKCYIANERLAKPAIGKRYPWHPSHCPHSGKNLSPVLRRGWVGQKCKIQHNLCKDEAQVQRKAMMHVQWT